MTRNLNGPDVGTLLLRLGLAFICLSHGAVKVLYNPFAWSGTAGLPGFVQFAVAWGEIVLGLALLVGLLTRAAAVGVALIQVGAILLETGQRGFTHLGDLSKDAPGFSGAMTAGWEYNFALICMALAVFFLGGGFCSLDRLLRRKKAAPTTQSAPAPPPAPVAPAPTA